ncbi:MAG: sterol desaturase family protein [Pseudomonadota bacterium]
MFHVGEASVRLILFWGGFLFFLTLEFLIPYRKSTVSKARRWVNNLSLTLFISILLHLIFASAIFGTVNHVQSNNLGVLNSIQAPLWIKVIFTVAFMDFMIYVWHLLNHKVPFLWRFHRVHHSDLNMDVSTATRFHIGELAISAVIKISIIYLLGATFLGVLIFESALVLCAQFHHSSLKVPKLFEAIFRILFIPPSMHRIHHSVIIRERDTNYGTIFSLWDRMLGTLLGDVDQKRIRIGMGAYHRPEQLDAHHLLIMPFTRPVR